MKKIGRHPRKFKMDQIRNIDKCRVLQKAAGKSVLNTRNFPIQSGFKSFDIKSQLATQNKEKKCKIDAENANDIFSENSPKILRRSTRLSSKSNKIEIKPPDYYEKLIEQDCILDLKEPELKKNYSKSLFRKVNQRSKEIEQRKLSPKIKDKGLIVPGGTTKKSMFSQYFPVKYKSAENFESILKSKLLHQVISDTLNLNTSQLFKEIFEVNNILSGQTNPKVLPEIDNNLTSILKKHLFDTEEPLMKCRLFPSSKWCYKTPPQKLISFNANKDHGLKPAVIHTTKKHRSLYEVNRNFQNVDFQKVYPKLEDMNVPINDNFLCHLGNFPPHSESNWNFQSLENNVSIDLTKETSPMDTSSLNLTNLESYQPTRSPINGNFRYSASRPTKNFKLLPKIVTDINFNQHHLETLEDFNNEFTLIKCMEGSQEPNDTFQFKVRKRNLFQDDEPSENIENIYGQEEIIFGNNENMFNFGKDENGNIF